jgi:nucleoside 2-deoxyribosyltransferase
VRVYISGALVNVGDLDAARELYEAIAATCGMAGCDAYVPHQHADPVRDAGLSNLEVARRDLAEIARADCLVAWLGEPSLGVGAEVAIALADRKPVLALVPEGRKVSRFLLGLLETSPALASTCRYRDREEALDWIARTLRRMTA